MNLFDQWVNQALEKKPDLTALRVVVEKELLHQDILVALSQAGLLKDLTFIGGTCLRACYGSGRLSEDLDFTGGADFSKKQLASLGDTLVQSLSKKYGLQVSVAEPVREEGNVDTWKLKVITRPQQRDLPAQRINIDVCAIPSYQRRPMLLLNPYGIDMGVSGLLLQAQSREEIFADKLVAFALRPNRLKNRDLWDMAWLHQLSIRPALELLPAKLADHRAPSETFLAAFADRTALMKSDPVYAKDYAKELSRFLPPQALENAAQTQDFWRFLVFLMEDYLRQIRSLPRMSNLSTG
jgi:predicted nucleotidyltransferase component of viral defense system